MTQNHTLETSGDGDGFTPGQHLQAISAAFFSGGGWVDPLTWDDYDAGGHAKWEEFARIVGTDIRRAVAAPEMFGELSYLADGNDWFGEQRFAEDTDADFLLRVLGAVRKRARAAVRKALGSDPQPIPVEGGDGSSNASLRPTPKSADTKAEPSGAFTPGPWAVDGDALVTLDPTERDMERVMIADLRYFTITHLDANARLIAAAPEMFAALKGLLALPIIANSRAHALGPEWTAARAAIAKALGPSAQDTSTRSDLARDESPPQVVQPIRDDQS